MANDCFMCLAAPGTNYMMFDESVGYFEIGGEPRMCDACKHKLHTMSIEERRTLFVDGGFNSNMSSPAGAQDPIGDAMAREHEIKNRAKA
jgi:hypothetical protein